MTRAQRSRCMARIRGRDTGPEIKLRKALWQLRLRYRLRHPLDGKPDIVFVKKRVAVFVDGCFWHGCPTHSNLPKNNAAFWATKLSRNKARDKQVTRILRRNGWTVIRVWEHALEKNAARVAEKIRKLVRSK